MTQITVATSPEEKQAIYRFRYQVYVEEMKKQPKDADHQARTIEDELDETALLRYITDGDQIIATLRHNYLNVTSIPAYLSQRLKLEPFSQAFGEGAVSVSSRLMIAPEYRNSSIVGALVLEAYRDSLERGIQFDFLCSAPWLLPFYTNMGYRRYTNHFLDSEVGLQVPQVLVLEDVEHLKSMRSPFYRVARHYTCSVFARNWFDHTFQPLQQSRQLQPDQLRWDSNPPELKTVFQGLEPEKLKQLLQATTIHKVRAGETIVQVGDAANAMFLILSGNVEISHRVNGTTRTVTSLSAAQTFGETNLFQQSISPEQAVALTDTELLIFPKPAIAKLTKVMPSFMCQLLFQASHAICSRYVPDISQERSAQSLQQVA